RRHTRFSRDWSSDVCSSDLERIFSIDSEETFNEVCLAVYHYQKVNCPVYGKYIDLLGKTETAIDHYTQIPFLPIDFFKTQQVLAERHQAEITFTSSGTTGMVTSQHHVAEISWYEKSFRTCFQQFYEIGRASLGIEC